MNFEYNSFTIPEAKFKISPSSIGKFFNLPSVWFKDMVLGEKSFIASTSTVLGTIIHGLAEGYATGEEVTREECDAYADKMQLEVPEVDAALIKSLYPTMAGLLINEYIRHNKPTIVEEAIYAEVKDGIFIGGSCDNLTMAGNSGTIVDYKNVGTKPNTDKIPFDYLIQLLAYAYCYRANGRNIDRVRIVYTVRPTKTLPARVFVVTHQISQDDWDLIQDTLNLIADSITYCSQHPEAIPLVFKSQKLAGQQINLT